MQSHNVFISDNDLIKPNPYYVDYKKQLEDHTRKQAIRKRLNAKKSNNINSLDISSIRKNRNANILKHVLGSTGDGIWE